MVDKGDDYSKVHKAYPIITKEEWEIFKNNCARKKDKDLRKWALDMHHMNIGSVPLGSRGYDRKRPMWEKEDVDPLIAAKIKPWVEFEDRRQREFIRTRCHRDTKTREYVTDKKMEQLIVELVIYLPVAFNQVDNILIVIFLNVSYVFCSVRKIRWNVKPPLMDWPPRINL
jgi:hypothetical protein